LGGWSRLGGPATTQATLALALALFAGIFVLVESGPNLVNGQGILFVLPIALLAVRFGLRGGLVGALLGFVLVVTWDVYDSGYMTRMLTVEGYAIHGITFLLLGTLLGIVVDERRKLQAEISRYYDESLDLLATIDRDGRFTHVNPAWERTLGHSAETMCSRPYIEFVHPDDREASSAESAVLARGERDAIGFRNRYRAADGSYRWLEWNARAADAEGVRCTVARDITAQHEAEQQLANNAQWLETKVAERTRELEDARAETLQRLAVAAEYHDDETFQHTTRVGEAAAELAAQLGAEEIELLREAAPLHDVGKLAIPDHILLKPGKLSAVEYEVMKTHAALGARLLSDSNSPVLQMAAVIAATHHERWDGTGYPEGLAGEAIPLVGRVVAVADVFDALTHDRPYKSAWSVEQAIAEIQRAAGSQFDPCVVAAFLAMHKDAAGAAETDSPRQRARTLGAPRKRRGSRSTARPVPLPALAGGRRSRESEAPRPGPTLGAL